MRANPAKLRLDFVASVPISLDYPNQGEDKRAANVLSPSGKGAQTAQGCSVDERLGMGVPAIDDGFGASPSRLEPCLLTRSSVVRICCAGLPYFIP